MKYSRKCLGTLLLLATLLSAPTSGAMAATVLFDQGHNQRFLADRRHDLDLSGLADQFINAGFTVKTTAEPLSATTLAGVDALVISGALAPLAPTEEAAVRQFLERGGRLSIMLHVPQPLAPLLEQLGVLTSNGVIRERTDIIGDEARNFRVSRLAPEPLFAGIRSFALYGSWALLNEGKTCRPLALTGPEAWIDLNLDNRQDQGDAVQAFAVIVGGEYGRGQFLVFADDAIFQNRFLQEGNLLLARNLVAWLGQPAADTSRSRRL